MVSTAAIHVACISFFAAAIVGAMLARFLVGVSAHRIQASNAFCGGVILSVALVHMLSENASGLDEVGAALSRSLGGDEEEPLPVGFFFAGCGFLLMMLIESCTGKSCNPNLVMDKGLPTKMSSTGDVEAKLEIADTKSQEEKIQCDRFMFGIVTWVGIALHSSIEAVATGASQDDASLFVLMSAVLAHKGFTCYAVGSALEGTSTARFWTLMTILALTGPLGIIFGATLNADFEGPTSAALQCVASGTLLAIGIESMLLPSLFSSDKRSQFGNFTLAFFGFTTMSLLAVWA